MTDKNDNQQVPDDETIQDYVFGELGPDEARAVAAAIKGNPAAEATEKRYKATRTALARERYGEMNQRDATRRTRARIKRFSMATAAMLVGFIVLGTVQHRNYSNEMVAQRNFDEGFVPPPLAGKNNPVLGQAKQDYADGNYEAARAGFEQLRSDSIDGPTARLYLSVIAFRTKEYREATERYDGFIAEDIRSLQEKDRRQAMRWNAMLNRLARGEDIEAELESGDWDPEKVAALRKQLSSFWRFD